jgi:hypothetical protein
MRGAVPFIAAFVVACSPADPAPAGESAQAASSLDASAEDISVMPSSIEVCIDGRDKPRGRFLVKNPTDQPLRVRFEPKGALMPTTVDVAPLGLETVVFEPLREAGIIAYRNETLAGADRSVQFVEKADVRVLSVRSDGNVITVSNPIPFELSVVARIEGPADFGSERYTELGQYLRANDVVGFDVRRTGVGTVRVSFVGPRCAGLEIPELPVIEIP